jgi:hypothetical protein
MRMESHISLRLAEEFRQKSRTTSGAVRISTPKYSAASWRVIRTGRSGSSLGFGIWAVEEVLGGMTVALSGWVIQVRRQSPPSIAQEREAYL